MATCAVKIGGMLFTVDYSDQQDLFSELGKLEEVFGYTSCGKCGNNNLKHVVRNVNKHTYFELRCGDVKNCRAKLEFGHHDGKDKTLFPKRKDKEGNWLKNDGWVVWEKPKE